MRRSEIDTLLFIISQPSRYFNHIFDFCRYGMKKLTIIAKYLSEYFGYVRIVVFDLRFGNALGI